MNHSSVHVHVHALSNSLHQGLR